MRYFVSFGSLKNSLDTLWERSSFWAGAAKAGSAPVACLLKAK